MLKKFNRLYESVVEGSLLKENVQQDMAYEIVYELDNVRMGKKTLDISKVKETIAKSNFDPTVSIEDVHEGQDMNNTFLNIFLRDYHGGDKASILETLLNKKSLKIDIPSGYYDQVEYSDSQKYGVRDYPLDLVKHDSKIKDMLIKRGFKKTSEQEIKELYEIDLKKMEATDDFEEQLKLAKKAGMNLLQFSTDYIKHNDRKVKELERLESAKAGHREDGAASDFWDATTGQFDFNEYENSDFDK